MSTARFFLFAFGFTFSLQFPAALARMGVLSGDPDAYLPLATLGIFGPLVAATWLTYRERGRAGVRALFRGLVDLRVPMRWAIAALFVPAGLLSLGLLAMRAAGYQGAWHHLPGVPQLWVALVVSVAEEVGWRGFALPRLIDKYGAFLGSCMLGGLWALWHVPMFIAAGIPMSLSLVMLLFFVGGSLYFTFLYQKARGSLLVAVLAHLGAHLNNSHAALPADTLPLLVHTVVYASLGLATMRRAAFHARVPTQRASLHAL